MFDLYYRFLPKLAKQTLDQTLEDIGIMPIHGDRNIETLTSCSVTDGTLRIGNTSCSVYQTNQLMKVPDTLFYDNALVSSHYMVNMLHCACVHTYAYVQNSEFNSNITNSL